MKLNAELPLHKKTAFLLVPDSHDGSESRSPDAVFLCSGIDVAARHVGLT